MHTRDSGFTTEDQEMRSKNRAHLVFFVWSIFVGIILVRALYIQGFKHSYYIDLANKQYISLTPISFDRGTVFFSEFKKDPVPVAQLRTTYRIAIDPTQLTNPDMVYTKISQYISLDKTIFLEKASKKNDPYEEIAKDISSETVAIIKAQKIVGVRSEERRVGKECRL